MPFLSSRLEATSVRSNMRLTASDATATGAGILNDEIFFLVFFTISEL